jgi:DNA-directed RNA polymerase specialized sigma24 family protein
VTGAADSPSASRAVTPGTTDPALDRALAVHHAQGRARHPSIDLPLATFTEAAGELSRRRLVRQGIAPTSALLVAAVERAAGADLYLAVACDGGVAGAWERFLHLYGPRLVALASARGLAPADADEVGHDVLHDLSAPAPAAPARTLLGTYDGAGSLFGWLATILVRRLWQRARRRTAPSAGGLPEASARTADPVDAAIDAETARRLRAAVAAATARCTPIELLALLGVHRHGWTQGEVARVLGVGRPRVSRLVARAVRRIRAACGSVLDVPRAGGPDLWPLLVDAISRALTEEASGRAGDAPTGAGQTVHGKGAP